MEVGAPGEHLENATDSVKEGVKQDTDPVITPFLHLEAIGVLETRWKGSHVILNHVQVNCYVITFSCQKRIK